MLIWTNPAIFVRFVYKYTLNGHPSLHYVQHCEFRPYKIDWSLSWRKRPHILKTTCVLSFLLEIYCRCLFFHSHSFHFHSFIGQLRSKMKPRNLFLISIVIQIFAFTRFYCWILYWTKARLLLRKIKTKNNNDSKKDKEHAAFCTPRYPIA